MFIARTSNPVGHTSLTTNWLKCTVSNIFAWGKAASLLKFFKAAVMQNGAEEGLDLSDKFKSMLADLRTCTICGPLHRFHKSHGSTSKHKVRPLNAAEKEEEIGWYRAIQADGDAARLKKLQEKRAVSRATQEAAQSAAAEGESPLTLTEDTGEYRFDFGKQRGQTLTRVWRSQRNYLPYLINQRGFLDSRLTLKRAMEAAGIMEEAQREAQALKIGAARKVLAEAMVAADTEIIPHEPEAKRKPKSVPRSTVEVAQAKKDPAAGGTGDVSRGMAAAW